MHDYRRILALVDFSNTGTAVARRAIKLARMDRAELAFLHLIGPDAGLDGGYPQPSRKECKTVYEQAALRRLAFFSANLGVNSGDAALWAHYGHPGRAFSDCVSAWRPDLVVADSDPGYLGGPHDLLILGHASTGGGLVKRMLKHIFSPAGVLGGA